MVDKVCKTHGLTSHVMEGRGYFRCKKCRTANVHKRRLKFKSLCVEYKGGCCELCGYDKYQGALEFHHLDPKEKDFQLSKTLSWDKAKTEMDKCIMLCANCHREVHAGLVKV